MRKKNIIKRFCAVVLSLALCFSLSGTAFAAEPAEFAMNEETEQQEASCYVLSDDGIMPLSSIGGYAHAVLTKNNSAVLVRLDASGIGGMGITVDTSCASGNYYVQCTGNPYPATGVTNASSISRTISTNGHYYWENLWHSSPAYYIINLGSIPEGVSVTVDVWIYG